MSKQLSRGMKRICQSETCALPFYDLNRTEIWCPTCGSVFDAGVVPHPRGDQAGAGSWRGARRSVHRTTVAPPMAKSQPQLDEDEEAASATDDVIDADADTLPLEDDADDEIADVIIPPVDDQAER